MKYLIFLPLLLSYAAIAQPMLNDSELVLEYHLPKECLKKDIYNCSTAKANASFHYGKTGDLQYTAVFKMSGDQYKLGGQAWYKINPYFWVGFETAGDLKLDLDHEMFFAGNFEYGDFTIFPYGSIFLDTEHFGSLSVLVYFKKRLVKFGSEYRFGNDKTSNELVLFAGFKVNKLPQFLQEKFKKNKENFEKSLGKPKKVAMEFI